jgi:hypothetical protein
MKTQFIVLSALASTLIVGSAFAQATRTTPSADPEVSVQRPNPGPTVGQGNSGGPSGGASRNMNGGTNQNQAPMSADPSVPPQTPNR